MTSAWLGRTTAMMVLAAFLTLVFVPQYAWAQETEAPVAEATEEAAPESEGTPAPEADKGLGYAVDNLFLLLAAVLVFFMQAGFAMVEAGFNASKNAVNILFKNSMDFCVGALLFFAFGFAIMYPGSYGADVATNSWWAYTGDFGIYEQGEGRTFAAQSDFLFQVMFAATAATIVSGAVAGRITVFSYLIYSAIISAFVYPVSGFWKWGDGWLYDFATDTGFHDFAGSGVVHTVGGFAGLAGAMILGPRIGRYVNGKPVAMHGHSLPLAALGVFILWFGWYGFNCGSMLAFQGTVKIDGTMLVAVNTTLAAAAGGLTATILSWVMFGKPDLGMALNGILGGLVGITAGCDCFTNEMSILVGAIAAPIVIGGVILLDKLQIDDPVGAFPVHGLCGLWGCMAIGILPNTYLTPETGDPLTSFMDQLKGSLACAVWAFATMLIVFGIMKAIGILRVSPEDEQAGLDISEHGVPAYGAGH